jgi:hypothetical protein
VTPSRTPALPQQLRRHLALAWLLLALVLAPTLGRMHQIVHGVPAFAAGHAHAAGEGTAHQALDTLHALFAGHSSADCQVLDRRRPRSRRPLRRPRRPHCGAWRPSTPARRPCAPEAIAPRGAPHPKPVLPQYSHFDSCQRFMDKR